MNEETANTCYQQNKPLDEILEDAQKKVFELAETGNSTIVKYVFRNAMLPQITGLAMSLGTMIGGNLVAEMVFSYPGLGTTMLSAVTGQDYPLLSACTLIITIMVLLANLLVELLYAVIDPRVKASQQD